MKNRIFQLSFFLIWTISLTAAEAKAQASAPAANHGSAEVAVEYTYVHSNAPPGGCDCFSLSGGSISVAQPFRSGHFAAVFDATVAHGSSISAGEAGNYDLTLAVFTVGLRYRPMPHSRWNPFGEILVGAAHADGTLVEGNTPAANDSSLVFATNIGGGIDRQLNRRLSIRLVEADWMLTTFDNGVNGRQNNLRLSTGIAYRFGK